MDGRDGFVYRRSTTSHQLYMSGPARGGDGQLPAQEKASSVAARKSSSYSSVMAEICCGIRSGSDTSAECEPSSRSARRRRMEIRRYKFISGVAVPQLENDGKRQKLEVYPSSSQRDCQNTDANCTVDRIQDRLESENGGSETDEKSNSNQSPVETTLKQSSPQATVPVEPVLFDQCPKFGMTSVCGRRREMEDAVAIHPSFCRRERQNPADLHFFGVYDGHGCSHVAKTCKDRLHHLVKEELENNEASTEWNDAMVRSFSRMDKEVLGWNEGVLGSNCRCELQTPQCDAVGSTAVVSVVTPDKIVVANCGDSRAVLSRNGKAVPLSSDHKPDRPDELQRIQDAGGRVIYWDGPRVLGVLAMSRAIGDSYLKPYVISEPEVTITDRTVEDDCMILASDGLWDVVSNETACGVARMCLRGQAKLPLLPGTGSDLSRVGANGESSDKACSDAAMLLTKMALARHSTDNVSVVVINLRRDTT
ncbi:hypothetical protein HHK36_018450 [Tetracentron sinense]|uniref:protein-serine/threonine phosphatase n=1 Tax=Tetracentron sinense TaxID=13715 RepID=A0A834Z4G0_TETSI|nr:hypothetical protein HHK36_018450 [Tetracentron sinense]